jgi:RNA-directed DNA polymerase
MAIDAVSHPTVDWHAIEWPKVYRTVRRLQIRIVKAVQAGQWRRVRALQRLLTRSSSGKALAVRRVTENSGRKTPGVDGEIWDTPTKKATALSQLKSPGYKPLPLRRIYISKSHQRGGPSGGVRPKAKRPLGIPAMKDRALQALHLLALDPIAETQADPHSYGFRIGRSPADAIACCFHVLFRDYAPSWILEVDIRACFDTISHPWLERHIPMEKTLLHKWLKAGYIDQATFHHTDVGTPQGSPISPVMCNMVLDGLEQELEAHFGPKTCRTAKLAQVNMVHFADDLILTGRSKELLQQEVMPLLERFLTPRGLELSPEKTRITHLEEGFDFLGQHIRKYKGKLLIKPSKKSKQSFLDKARKIVKGNSQAKTGHLIAQLNPLIRGWANYHRHVVSKKTFSSIDDALFKCLWQWAKRRHPNKPRRWIKRKYFKSIATRHWVFSGETGDGKELQLMQAADVAIERHTQIRGAVNPYDPKDERYFDQRLGAKWLMGKRGKDKLRRLWLQQEGICPLCHQRITDNPGWEIHHIVRRVDGGPDTLTNLVLLHPNCHRQVHVHGLSVAKPGLVRGLREA